MNKPHKSFNVDEGKIQASILLKSLYSNDFMISQKAAKRFQRLAEFKDLSLSEIIKADIKRKIDTVIYNEKLVNKTNYLE